MRSLVIFAISILRSARALFRSREEQAIVELALRQQLAVYAQDRPRPRLSPLDRTFWVALSRLWPQWRNHLVVVRPETVVRWHRQGFRRYWRSISTPGPGRPPISKEVQELIVRMATENCWRSRKIQAELMKLDIRISLATVSRYVPKTKPDPSQQQRWITFLRNHKDMIAGFLHLCGKTEAGKFLIVRRTQPERMRRKLRAVKAELKRRRHRPIPEQGKWLRSVVNGHFAYYAVPTNGQGSWRSRSAAGR